MTVEELIIYGKKHIHKNQTILLLSSLLNIDYFDIFKDLNKKVDKEIVKEYKKLIKGIKENVPIQYLLETTNFYGYDFKVNKSVLIPRFETEHLVEKTARLIKLHFTDNLRIIDIGTGSGVIAIILKKFFPNALVDAIDISSEALDIAKENAKKLEVDIKFIKGDMLDNLDEKYNVLISNPPYIPVGDKVDISTSCEPNIALYGGEDGCKYYRKIINESDKVLLNPSLIAFEIGSMQKEKIIKIIKNKYPNADVFCEKDLNNCDRYLFAMIKN